MNGIDNETINAIWWIRYVVFVIIDSINSFIIIVIIIIGGGIKLKSRVLVPFVDTDILTYILSLESSSSPTITTTITTTTSSSYTYEQIMRFIGTS